MTQHFRKDTLGKSVSFTTASWFYPLYPSDRVDRDVSSVCAKYSFILTITTDISFDILSAMAMCEANGRLLHMLTECVNELLGLAQTLTFNPPNQHDMFANAVPLTVESVLTAFLSRSK